MSAERPAETDLSRLSWDGVDDLRSSAQAVLDVIDRFIASAPDTMHLYDFFGDAEGAVAVERLRAKLADA